jgi:predicted enzyme related to lactoylglutathione lyase
MKTNRKPFVRGVGGILSADIAVPNHELELDFYSKVLTTGSAPLWRDDLMNNQGQPVIGLGVRVPEYESLPLQWMPHFQVADVATSVERALELGATEIMSQTEEGQSQWAVLTDQDGAAFGVIPVVEESGSETGSKTQNDRIGSISWLSLTVADAIQSCDFYRQVIGWNGKSMDNMNTENASVKFEMQIDDEAAAAEICQRRSEEEGIPSVWLMHLPVDDLAESLQRVRESDGEVIEEYNEADYAVVRDPVGVYLALRAG